MAQRVNRSGRGPGRPAAKKKPAKRKATVKGAFVKLGIMGNGTYEACIKLGETSIKQLFEQVNKHESTDFKPGETIYMNGKAVKEDAIIKLANSTVTSTMANEGN